MSSSVRYCPLTKGSATGLRHPQVIDIAANVSARVASSIIHHPSSIIHHPSSTSSTLNHSISITPAQVLLKWSLQNNVITIPASSNLHRATSENYVYMLKGVLVGGSIPAKPSSVQSGQWSSQSTWINWELTEEEMDMLSNLYSYNLRCTWDPTTVS